MDTDCEMNHQFAKRLRKQQMSSPSLVVLRDMHNTTPVHVPTCTEGDENSCDVMEHQKPNTITLDISPKLSQVQRWLFPPTDDTPPPSQEDKESVPVLDEDMEDSCDSFLSFTSSNSSTSHDRLSTPAISPSPTLKVPCRNTVNISADRYIPSRLSGNLQTRFSMIPDGSSLHSPSKKSKNKRAGERDKDNHPYSCLLRNELLGTNIESLKCHPLSSPKHKNFFRYSSSVENEQNIEEVAPYSPWSVGSKSQKLLRSSHKSTRQICRIPIKVLDAPDLADDFYLNLVDWSPHNMLCVGLGSHVYLWSSSSGVVTRLCDLSSEHNGVTSVAWSERGNYLAVGTHSGYVQVWDVSLNKRINMLNGHSARVSTLAWNGNTLSSGSRDCTILQHDVRVDTGANNVRRLAAHNQEICGLKWSPDNQYLASGGNDNRLYVWNMHSISPMQTYTEHLAAVKAIAWSPHHHGLLASGGGTADRCIRFWNTLTGQPMQCVDTGSQVCNLAWSKHSSELIKLAISVGGRDEKQLAINTMKRFMTDELAQHFSYTGKKGFLEKKHFLFQKKNFAKLCMVSTHGYPYNLIHVWKYPSMRQLAKVKGHSCRVSYMAVSPDGEDIVTGAGDETLRFWKVFSKDKSFRKSKSTLSLYCNIR